MVLQFGWNTKPKIRFPRYLCALFNLLMECQLISVDPKESGINRY